MNKLDQALATIDELIVEQCELMEKYKYTQMEIDSFTDGIDLLLADDTFLSAVSDLYIASRTTSEVVNNV